MERLDQVEVSGALDEIWQRVRALNRFVQDQAPWQLSKDPAQADRLDQVLYGAGRGPARGRGRCCTRGCPSRPTACSQALGSRGPLAGQRAPRRRRRRRQDRRAGPALPEGRGARALGRLGDRPGRAIMVDTHCHLDSCEPPDADLVGARPGCGGHADRHGRHARRVDPARGGRGQRVHDEVVAIVGRHPHHSEGFGDGRPRRDRGGGRRPARSRDRRDRAGLLPRPRPARRPAAGVRGPAGPGRAARAAGGHPHPSRRAGHLRHPGRARRRRSP